ncbi:undecaprenyldiphospho-muramoylpentapeptide beta-N-acetylglucosaminyltransferase [bacterium]|nr:undecaprenyldiphospho-muramoylpentapeptide beta-N-acetylglucosaminyltransferase [bacterium]
MSKKVYFVTGGGTGGHIYPAVAVADALMAADADANIFYVGNPNNMEKNIVSSKTYTFLPVYSSGMPRKFSFEFIKWSYLMFAGWLKCCYYILKYKPDAVFGTGGYVSAPVLFAAITMKVPFVMHDCDANPGLVTRKLAPYAKSVSVAFDVAKSKIKNKNCFVNGNPIRKEFSLISKQKACEELSLSDKKCTLCIMGGSQGAKSINNSVIPILKDLSEKLELQIIFQTGRKNYDEVTASLKKVYPEYENNNDIIVRPYFDNMVSVLKASDIAISRAGSLSISELCASGVATIFIPYPYAAADHQRKNARYMFEKGAGLYLEDSDADDVSLMSNISSLVNDKAELVNMQSTAKSLAVFDGAERIVKQIQDAIS